MIYVKNGIKVRNKRKLSMELPNNIIINDYKHSINPVRYGCDLVFTPMIVADCFVKSVKARDMEFTTNAGTVIIRTTSYFDLLQMNRTMSL